MGAPDGRTRVEGAAGRLASTHTSHGAAATRRRVTVELSRRRLTSDSSAVSLSSSLRDRRRRRHGGGKARRLWAGGAAVAALLARLARRVGRAAAARLGGPTARPAPGHERARARRVQRRARRRRALAARRARADQRRGCGEALFPARRRLARPPRRTRAAPVGPAARHADARFPPRRVRAQADGGAAWRGAPGAQSAASRGGLRARCRPAVAAAGGCNRPLTGRAFGAVGRCRRGGPRRAVRRVAALARRAAAAARRPPRGCPASGLIRCCNADPREGPPPRAREAGRCEPCVGWREIDSERKALEQHER
mmetsp:Transcript_14037/g.41182  ORF Transcript_14037/g.41182 Transcript_14037/m.41182 type:complete len:311 (+) Transcript_14037:85-1017(+)